MKKLPATKENLEQLLNLLIAKEDSTNGVAKELKRRRVKGKRRSSEYCPVARYLRNRLAVGRNGYVTVGVNHAFASNGGISPESYFQIDLPQSVMDFVGLFDTRSLNLYSELELVDG